MKKLCFYAMLLVANAGCFSKISALSEEEKNIIKQYLVTENETDSKNLAEMKESIFNYFWTFKIYKGINFDQMIDGVDPIKRKAIRNFAYDLQSDTQLSGTLPGRLVFFYTKIKKAVDNFEVRYHKFREKDLQLTYKFIKELVGMPHFHLSVENLKKTITDVVLADRAGQALILEIIALLVTGCVELVGAVKEALQEDITSFDHEFAQEIPTIDAFIDSLTTLEESTPSVDKSEL